MKIVAIILARGGSVDSRKNIKLINNLPLIAYTIKQCLSGISEIYTSSDDKEILELQNFLALKQF